MSLITGMVPYYNDIGMVLQQWAELGVFEYVFPFILIFSIIFAILGKVPTFKDNKGINVLIAFSVAALSLQFNIISLFLADLFPKLGVGVSILLVAFILLGTFIDDKKIKWVRWVFFSLGAIIFLAVVLSSLGNYTWWDGWWWRQYAASMITALVVFIIIIVAIVSQNNNGKTED